MYADEIHQQEYGLLLINSENRTNGTASNFNYQVGTVISNVYNMGLERIRTSWNVPNINPRNSNFFYDDGTTTWSIIIPTGFYTGATLATAMQTQMQAVSGDATITVTFNTFGQFNISSGATNVGIANTNVRVRHTYGLFNIAPVVNSVTFNVAKLTYTDFYDLCSPDLLQYTRHDSTQAFTANKIINRIYLNGNQTTPYVKEDIWNNIKYFKYETSASVGYITLIARDQFGDEVYSTSGGFDYLANLLFC